MAFETINLGTQPAGTGGDTARSAFEKTNRNFLAAEVLSAAMSQAQFEASREQNKRLYAASGWVHKGKHAAQLPNIVPVNEGLWTFPHVDFANKIILGRKADSYKSGKSQTDSPVLHMAGVIFDLGKINNAGEYYIKFPDAADGRTTYNKSTGAIVKHPTITAAFNAYAADPINIEVVTDRTDMWAFEAWPEVVSAENPFIYQGGLINSVLDTMDGVKTSYSNRPAAYYAVFDGDTSSKGKGLNFFALSEQQKKKVLSNPENNLYYSDDGRLIQWRLRQRTIAGAGNGALYNIDSLKNIPLRLTNLVSVAPQGGADSVSGSGVTWYAQYLSEYNIKKLLGLFAAPLESATISYNGECYMLVCGSVNRLNQGAYHHSFNPKGASKVCSTDGGAAVFWHSYNARKVNRLSDCFYYPTGGYPFSDGIVYPDSGRLAGAGGGSGRPDGRSFNGIYPSGIGGICRDMRYAAIGVSFSDYAEADQRVKSCVYRGYENLKFTKVVKTTLKETAVYGGGRYFRFDGYQPWELFTADSCVYFPRINVVAYPCLIESWDGGATYLCMEKTGATTDMLITEKWRAFAPFSGDVFAGDDVYIMSCKELNDVVGGEFLQSDVVGPPAIILAIPALANGWLGGWVSPFDQTYKLTREALLAEGGQTYTTDNGATWGSATLPINKVTNDLVKGGENLVLIAQYQAFSKQTENAINAEIYGANTGVGSVYCTSTTEKEYGAVLAESTIGKTLKGSWQNGKEISQLGLMTNYIDPIYKVFTKNYGFENKHSQIDIVSPLNNSPAFKALNYNVNLNQQAFIQYAYTELKHNGTNWGDDGKVTIVDNQATKTDLNGNTVLVGTAKLKEPIGWIKNKV